ncbi:MAG: hypothetical protein COA57_07400 [Flavobacteriales bacterium]|nr:MAG: hypothetical protein COA57_07400 [Flavobacteriales bacterium]
MLVNSTGMAQTNTWTGNTDTDWHKSCNWSLNAIPTCAHDVVIPNVVNDPIITGIAHCNTIDIQSSTGALLTINSSGSGLLEVTTCPTAATDNGGCSVNLLPNPSFEDMSCCPSGLAQMTCVDFWINAASGGSADYFNTCDFTSTAGGPPPSPIPDGAGYVGFLDYLEPFPSFAPRKEYIGVCLPTALTSGQSYTFEFELATSSGSSSVTIAIYGTTSCANLPYAGVACPTTTAGWVELGSVAMTPDNVTWQAGTIAFTAGAAYIGLAIGPNCTNPPPPPVNPDRYYYMDNLQLY